ncbi:hypothetical protein [Kordiimonas sp.]|uniref:hypothetical protein n=1 Tax=Kordiimonas sp. TaxID=1970157 RepID=UPI003B5287F6
MSWDIAANIATVFGIPFAIVGLGFTAYGIFQQRKSSDVASILELNRDIDSAWERYRGAEAGKDEFEFGQILVLYETMCYLFNKGLVGRSVIELLKTHIIEVIAYFTQDETAMSLMVKSISGRNTFSEINKFIDNHFEDYSFQLKGLKDARDKQKG